MALDCCTIPVSQLPIRQVLFKFIQKLRLELDSRVLCQLLVRKRRIHFECHMYVPLSLALGLSKKFVRVVNRVSLEQCAIRVDIQESPQMNNKVCLRVILWSHFCKTLLIRSFAWVLSRARCSHQPSCTSDRVVCRDLVIVVSGIPFVIHHHTLGLCFWWHGMRLAKIMSLVCNLKLTSEYLI